MQGYLKVFFGPMFSGKTKRLWSSLSEFASVGRKVCCIRPEIDTREKTTHNNDMILMSGVKSIRAKTLWEVDYLDYDVIGIDEAQFFPDIEEFVKKLMYHKVLMVSGLALMANNTYFGEFYKIIPLADDIVQCKAFCVKCKNNVPNAIFTNMKREAVNENCGIVIGGDDIYEPVCRNHKL